MKPHKGNFHQWGAYCPLMRDKEVDMDKNAYVNFLTFVSLFKKREQFKKTFLVYLSYPFLL
jgi:hypothetical protein